jgi:phosphatidate cytidylyltransferase
MPLRFSEHKLAWATGRELVFLVFLVIWAGDIFAYLGGRAVGRTPLFPRVSPKKTAEGAVAGFAGSLLVAWVLVRWFWQTADLKTVMLWAAMIALAGQVGDLVESALKRGADLKDSGSILPGHGGLLDRIDSLLFGVPALWLALTLKEMLK